MKQPTRLYVLKGFRTLLEGITPANGYVNNLTGSVFQGRTTFGPSDPETLVVFNEKFPEGQVKMERADAPKIVTDVELILQGFAPFGTDGSLDPAYFLAADVQQRIAKEVQRAARRYDLLGLNIGGSSPVTEVSVGWPTIRPSESEGGQGSMFWLEVHLSFAENRLDPWVDSQV